MSLFIIILLYNKTSRKAICLSSHGRKPSKTEKYFRKSDYYAEAHAVLKQCFYVCSRTLKCMPTKKQSNQLPISLQRDHIARQNQPNPTLSQKQDKTEKKSNQKAVIKPTKKEQHRKHRLRTDSSEPPASILRKSIAGR